MNHKSRLANICLCTLASACFGIFATQMVYADGEDCCAGVKYDPEIEECCGGTTVVALGWCCNGAELGQEEECCGGIPVTLGRCCNDEELREDEECCRPGDGDEYVVTESLAVEPSTNHPLVVWFDNEASMHVTPTGGCAPYTYEWDLPADVSSEDKHSASIKLEFEAAGVYEIAATVTDANDKSETVSFTVHALHAWPWASNLGSDREHIEDSSKPLDVEIVLSGDSGLSQDDFEFELAIKPASSAWHNEAGKTADIEPDADDPSKYSVYPFWYTPHAGGCVFEHDSAGIATGSIPCSYEWDVTVKYAGEEIGVGKGEPFSVVIAHGFQARAVYNYPPEALVTITEPLPHPTILNAYYCELHWNGSWVPKTATIDIHPYWDRTQYADLVHAEEAYHQQQWEGTVPFEEGGCEDLWTDEGTKFLQGVVGDTPIAFYAEDAEEAKFDALSFLTKAVDDEDDESIKLLEDRRYLQEIVAKEHAGFEEALTLPCTYPHLQPVPVRKHLAFQ